MNRKPTRRKNPAPRKPIPRKNVKRHKANHERSYGEKRAWITNWPCCLTTCYQTTRSEAAHTEGGGMGRKAGSETLVPLCQLHHRESHRGIKTFQAKYGIDLKALAAGYEARWQAHTPEDR